MATTPPTWIKPAELRRRILETIAANPWSEEQRTAIRDFANGLTNRTGPEEIVGDYLKLVRRLGERHGLGESMVITEGGRLLVFLDAKVYQGVPVGEIIDPVEWIRKKLNTRSWSKIHRKLEGWISALPERLHTLTTRIASGALNESAKFQEDLCELVRRVASMSGVSVSPRLKEACDAVRQGRTCVVEVPSAGCFAFYWPQTRSFWPELLSGTQAVRFVDSIGKPKSERSLRDLAKEHPALKRGSKFVRDELERAVAKGLLDHGNRKDG
jgi:hypothetical protein